MSNRHLSNTLSVEANVGAGKSTLLRVIAPILQDLMIEGKMHAVFEPIDQWKRVGPKEINVLEEFYTNPGIAYEFQTMAFTTRLNLYVDIQRGMGPSDMALIERSVFGDHTMAENCYASGLLTETQMACYEAVFQGLLRAYPHRPLGHIYLDTPPSACVQRIRERARPEESTMTSTLGKDGEGSLEDEEQAYKYIYDIHNAHQQNFSTKSGRSRRFDLPILKLDGSLPFHTNRTVQLDFAKQILAFYKTVMLNE